MEATLRSYTSLVSFSSFQDRFRYLMLRGAVGDPTFGSERWVNQDFYTSHEWKLVRNFVIARDEGRDLGVPGYEIYGPIHVHHMNPMSVDDIVHGNESILDPEFLISVSHRTHNAIHYGDESQIPWQIVERRPGDTQSW